MSEEATTIVAGGVQYRVTKVGGKTGGRIIFRGGQALASALTEGFSSKGIDSSIAVMMALVRRLPIEDFDWLCDEMAKCTQVGIVDKVGDGRTTFTPLGPLYDDHFRGRYMALVEWLKGALETNFGAFFAELQERVYTLGGAAGASGSSLPKAQTPSGSSGASSSASG